MKLIKCQKNKKELNEELVNLFREQFSLRIQLASGQLQKTHLLKKIRRDIAKVKTLLANKEIH